jgi:hypothetical protein
MWILKQIEKCFSKFSNSYSSRLEEYIVSRNPQSEADVERLTIEFHRRMSYY